MIYWNNVEVTEPPITMNVTDSYFDSFILDKTVFDFENYPLHMQAVERAIKLELLLKFDAKTLEMAKFIRS